MKSSVITEEFNARVPMLKAFGRHVVVSVVEMVKNRLGSSYSPYYFRMSPISRVKEVESFIEKCSRGGKCYNDPIREITDQVGARFVVLRLDEIRIVNDVINQNPNWDKERAKDMEQIKLEDPHYFDYVSDHWVVRPKQNIDIDGVVVPRGTPCEIQVRTLLQHAYAELAHATVYKPNFTAEPMVRRAIARGAALIETTDGVFVEVGSMIDKETAKFEAILAGARLWFADLVGGEGIVLAPSPRAMRIVDAYSDHFQDVSWDAIELDLRAKPWLKESLKSKRGKRTSSL